MNKTCFKQQMWMFLFIWWRQSTLPLCWLQIYLCDLWGQKQMNVSFCSYEFITADKTENMLIMLTETAWDTIRMCLCVCLCMLRACLPLVCVCVCTLTNTVCLCVQCVSVSWEGGAGWLAPTWLKPAFRKCRMFSQGKEFVLICRVSQMLWAGN